MIMIYNQCLDKLTNFCSQKSSSLYYSIVNDVFKSYAEEKINYFNLWSYNA
jgi:hypothetical protein